MQCAGQALPMGRACQRTQQGGPIGLLSRQAAARHWKGAGPGKARQGRGQPPGCAQARAMRQARRQGKLTRGLSPRVYRSARSRVGSRTQRARLAARRGWRAAASRSVQVASARNTSSSLATCRLSLHSSASRRPSSIAIRPLQSCWVAVGKARSARASALRRSGVHPQAAATLYMEKQLWGDSASSSAAVTSCRAWTACRAGQPDHGGAGSVLVQAPGRNVRVAAVSRQGSTCRAVQML